MSQTNVTFVQSLYAAFARGDIATIVAGLAPDVDWRVNGNRSDYPLFGSRKGPREVQAFFEDIPKLQDFSEFTPREFLAAGERVFVLGHYAATIRKTGRKAETDWVHIHTVRDGKVAAFAEFTDTAQFAQAWKG
jgi:ketosteroid isomerase-like protein